MNDYETNRKKSGGVSLIGLAYCLVWIYFFGHNLVYLNQTFQLPAGKNTSNGAIFDCYYQSTTGHYGPLVYPDGNFTYTNYENVTAQFAIVIKVGLSLFCLKALAFLLHLIKPHKKAGGAKAGLLSCLFLAWFIATNVIIYRPAGRYCSSEYVSDAQFAISATYQAYNVTGLFLWRTVLALYILGALGFLCLCLALCCARRRSRGY